MTKHTSDWHRSAKDPTQEPWKEIYLYYFLEHRKAEITRQRNRIIITIKKDYYQRIIRLPK